MHPLFNDYKTIRHRIERNLARPDSVLLHSLIFFFATFLVMAGAPNVTFDRPLMLLVWSGLLMMHSLAMTWLSGVPKHRREAWIKHELKQRLENDDTDLVSNNRQAFRVQALLDEDIRHRSGIFVTLSVLLGLNVMLWLGSVWQTGWVDPWTSGYWHEAARLVLVSLIPAVAFNLWRHTHRDQAIEARLANTELDVSDKRKRLSDEDYVFDEDGELVDDVAEHLMLEDEEQARLKM